MLASLNRAEFEQQFKDCLAHYDDFAYLQQHSLVRALTEGESGDGLRVQHFREQIEQAINCLNPGSDPSLKQARFYNILFLRYVKQLQVQHALFRLNLGERQFYRDHNKAIHALSEVLWQRVQEEPEAHMTPISIQSEVQRIHRQESLEQISPHAFLQKTLTSIQSLLEQYQVEITFQVEDHALLPANDSAVLRQAIIWVLARLIINSWPSSHFSISYRHLSMEGEFVITCQDLPKRIHSLPILEEETLQNLVQALDGTVEARFTAPGSLEICLGFPLRKHSVLIIDDNPDAVALFRHYLAGYPYQILTAYESSQALQIAQDSKPDVIVLDVLLPEQDGWEILHSLKNQVSTLRIPVLICSVLDSPELAHVLGADGFLHKPPSEADFLSMVSQFSNVIEQVKPGE